MKQWGKKRGMSLVETLAAVTVLAIASTGAIATWRIAVRLPASKRVTEMGVYIGARELERIKALTYFYLPTGTGAYGAAGTSPVIRYYTRSGADSASRVTPGYKSKTWVSNLVDRDSISNSEDLKEIVIEVWDDGETTRYETVRTLLAFGGV